MSTFKEMFQDTVTGKATAADEEIWSGLSLEIQQAIIRLAKSATEEWMSAVRQKAEVAWEMGRRVGYEQGLQARSPNPFENQV